MPDIIKLLPDSIANQIAAGEVIQRPASAVKEMMENSIDAGSSNIQLIIKDAGKTLIQVIDNGCGMSDTDARMSFERHATSKIRSAEDLFLIRTMGFRGEALASIAAIAQVEMKSRRHEDELGTQIIVEGSDVKLQEPCQAMPGTSVSIKNLFYNTPARRNFLKSNNVEFRNILDEFQRIALAHPEVGFSLQHNGLEIYHLPAGNLKKRIVNVFGNNYNQRLVPVEEETDVVSIKGFIGTPDSAKKTRGEQYFFVNKRFIKSPYRQHAIAGAYDELLPPKSFPLFVLFINVDPARIDVNVHPTKQEIKFEDERIIYAYIRSAVKRALGKHSITPTLDFEQETAFGNFETFQNRPSQERETGQEDEKQFITRPSSFQNTPSAPPNWKEYYKTESVGKDTTTITISSNWPDDKQHATPFTGSGEEIDHEDLQPYQIHQSYILAPIKSGLLIIDQQAAHERILFEKYQDILKSGKSSSQKQLFPQTIHFNTADVQMLKQILPDLNTIGFDIQEFGNNDFVVHGMPPQISGNEQEIIEGLLEQFKLQKEELKLDRHENLARAMARQTSIKKGKVLSAKEMKTLLDELFACRDFITAPNGKATFIKYSLQDIEKQLEKAFKNH